MTPVSPQTSGPNQDGILITFEGIDGCGKTTQISLARDFFTSRGYMVVTSHEPGGSSIGPAVRALLLDAERPPCSLAEALLFTAERCQHVHERVRPALDRGEIILLDRHTDSTLAYQGYGSGQDLTILRTLNALATGRITPKITFLLDLDPREAASRMTQGGRKADRFEREADDFHQRVRAGFLTLAQAEPERIKVINAAVDADSIAKQIQTYLEQLTEKSHA